MPPSERPFLYSTNPFIKYFVNEEYYGGKHYLWCSEYFDPARHGWYTRAYGIPPSSSPASLYRRYQEDIKDEDAHSLLIGRQKVTMKAIAVELSNKGAITQEELEEITLMVDKGRMIDWRPVIYVVSRELVKPRLKRVTVDKRAGIGIEYIIEDATKSEFDLMEI